MKSIIFKKDDIIYKESDTSESLYLIKSGSIVLLKEHDKMHFPVYTLHEKDILGEISVFDKTKRFTSAIALNDVELVEIEAKDVHERVENSPIWVKNLIITLLERYSNLLKVISDDDLYESISKNGLDFYTTKDLQYFKGLLDQ